MTQMFPMYFTLYYNLHNTLIVIWQTDNTLKLSEKTPQLHCTINSQCYDILLRNLQVLPQLRK